MIYNSAVYGAQHNDFDAGFNSRVATVFYFSHPMILDRSTISDRLRFALRPHGLRRFLRRTGYIFAPCGWEQGAKWDHIRVGLEEPSRGLFCFPAFYGKRFQKPMYLQHGELYCLERKHTWYILEKDG